MADHAKILKSIKDKKAALVEQERLHQEWSDQLAMLLAMNDPAALAEFRAEMDSSIATHAANAKRLRDELDSLEAQLPKEPEAAVPKFDPEKHPLLRKTLDKQEPEKAVVFGTGDMVEAQWTDKSWYKAKIQSVLGSASAPKYLVRFVEYDDTMTIDHNAVRPLQSKRKRDAEPLAPNGSTASATTSSHIVSGAPTVNISQITNANVSNDVEPKKAKKVPNKGTLNKRANAWQDWQTKSGKKMPKKESMFRTSTEVGSRVGFTGSGKGMTETQKRMRYDHKADAEIDEEFEQPARSGYSAPYTSPPPSRGFPRFTSPPNRKRR